MFALIFKTTRRILMQFSAIYTVFQKEGLFMYYMHFKVDEIWEFERLLGKAGRGY